MIVCICNRVTDLELKRLIEAGVDLEKVKQLTKAGNQCGTCLESIISLFNTYNR